MAQTFTSISLAQSAPATGTVTDLFTVPSTEKRVVREILVCNPTATDSLVNIYAVPSGGVADATNIIFSNVSVVSNDTIILDASTTLDQGDKLSVETVSGGVCTYRVSGFKVV